MPHPLRQHLLSSLQAMPDAPRYWIALSGGLDSTVLIHLIASVRDELGAPIHALHVDHGLSTKSADWSGQCRIFCDALDIPITIEQVAVSNIQDKGLEAAARQARYAVFEKVLDEGEVLLTAHHRDDQAETLLLQLFRGGGVHGLAAMPSQRPLGRGRLVRPLLDISRENLMAYAREQGLQWIDDPSNFDTSLERNYLRHTLLPQLAERREGIRDILARSAGHFAESACLLDELAQMDWLQAQVEESELSVRVLKAMRPARSRNLLRFTIRQMGFPIPQHVHLERILDEVLSASEDAMPLVAWPGAEVRRYRDRLYVMKPLTAVPQLPDSWHWDGQSALRLPAGLGTVVAVSTKGRGVSQALLKEQHVAFRIRQGGEKLQPVGREGHHALKKLYQEAGVPPWERERRPLLFINGQLAQVPGLWTAQEFAVKAGEEGLFLQWSLSAIENERQNDDNYQGPAPK